MPTDLPAAALAAVNAERIADDLAVLVTISDSTLDTPLRWTNKAVSRISTDPLAYGLVSDRKTYRFALRGVTLPDETGTNSQDTTIVIDNVVEDAAPALRGLTADATVDLAVVLVSAPDTQFLAFSGLKIVDRSYDMETVSIDVSRHANRNGANDLLEPLSGERQTKRKAPGLHR